MIPAKMTGIILSGGNNSRMGTNKAFLELNGIRFIDHSVDILKNIFQEVIIVTNFPLSYLDQNVTIVTDIMPNKGPLGGLYTGLFFAAHKQAFVCACDMPFLDKNFVEYMVESSAIGDYDILSPDAGDGWQPLHAIYGKRCLPAIKKNLEQCKLKLTGFYQGQRVLTIGGDVIRKYDPTNKLFLNINSYDDLKLMAPENILL